VQERGSGGRATLKPQLRRAALAYYLDVAPEDALGVTCAQGLHRGLLGGKAPGKVGRGIPSAGGIGDLAVGENPTQKPVSISGDGRLDAIDFGGIHSDTDNI
jgi:hypothetical protein